MPTFNKWRGDAQGRRQVDLFRAENVEIGDIFRLVCNRKKVSYTATAATPANVHAGLLALLLSTDSPPPEEFREGGGVLAELYTNPSDGIQYLKVSGPADGTPLTWTTDVANASINVLVSTSVEGVTGRNEKQRVRLGGTPTGGTFTLTFAGQTTGAIAYNASAATVTAALEALSNIAAGDVSVVLNATSDWTVEFIQNYAQIDVPLLTGSGALLTGGGGVSVATTQSGGGVSEVQRVEVIASTATFYLGFNGSFTSGWNSTASALQIQSALEALPTIGAGNILVTKTDGQPPSPATTYFICRFVGSLGSGNQPMMVFGPGSPGGYSIDEITPGGTQNEIQAVTLTGGPTGGTFTLTFQGQTTAGIAFDADAATVEAALIALSNIAAAEVAVTGAAGGPWTVTFQNGLGGADVGQMTGSGASLTGGSVNVSVTQTAVSDANEVQTVTLQDIPSSGTFTLTFNGETTGTIAYNASAATVQAALEGLATPVPGDFAVTGAAGGPWTVTFTGAYAASNIAEMTADGSLLAGVGTQTFTKTPVIVPTGPYHMDDANNWTLGHTPADGEIVVFENSDRPVKYGLIFASIEPLEIIFESTFEADAGLEDYNPRGYYEYRDKEITFGTAPGANSIKVTVGRGEGNGSSLIRICTNDVQTELDVYLTGPMKKNHPAVLWRGTHASNSVNVYRGSVGIAVGAGELATVDQLRMSYVETIDSDAYVVTGPAVTLNTVTKDAGFLQCDCAIVTACTQLAGDTDFNGTGALAQLNTRGGVFNYNSTGALNGSPIVSGDGQLVFDHDLRPKTVANPIDVYGDEADVIDSYKVAGTNGFTAGDFVIDYNETTRQPSLGRNYRLIRRATA